jgi:predicted ester cyclase
MSTDENKAIVQRYIDEAVNKGNLAVIDEVMDPNYVNPILPGGMEPGGAERYKQGVSRTRASFPDIQVTFDCIVAEGDLVAYESVWRGTHLGPFRGIAPTGKRVEWRATCFRRLRDGILVEGWGTYDWLGLLEQLGASPE